MDEASFGTITGINADGTANFGKRNSFVTFFRGTRLNQNKSVAEGVPVYDAVDMIKIVKPGERDEIHRLADEYDKRRYAAEWKAYCENIELAVPGTPLSALLPVNPEIVDHLRALKIVTVQQLASLNDSAIGNVQFGHDLRKKAQKYLAVAEGGAEFHRLEKETEAKDATIRQLQDQVQALEQRMNTLLQNQATNPPAAPQQAPVGGFAPALQQPANSPKPPPLVSDDEEEAPAPARARRR